MIASVTGRVTSKGQRFLVLETGGVGYKIFVTLTEAADVKPGEELSLFTHHHVSETAQELYGFRSADETAFFESLLTVSGVGPKTALNVMSIASLDELREGIQQSDATLLTKVSGIGRKTAERIVLELQEKVKLQAAAAEGTLADDAAVLDALVSLGYSRNEARQTVRGLPKSVTGVSDRVREALKRLGGHGE